MWRKCLLTCGIASSITYFAMDIIGSLRWDGYSYLDQTVSELAAISAPSRPIAAALGMFYNLLLLPFAAGVAASHFRRGSARVTAVSLAGIGLAGFIAAFFPIQMRGAGAWTINETMHVTLTSITVGFILVAMVSALRVNGPRFFIYTVVTIAVMMTGGAVSGAMGRALAENLPTPWMGVAERVCIFSYLVWVMALALVLLRQRARVQSADVMLAA